MKKRTFFDAFAALMLCLVIARAAPEDYYAILVVDEQTGRGVPLVELTTVNNVSWWTDSNGLIAFDEPGSWGQEFFFHVRSHGYEYPRDGFGNRGLKLKPVRGGSATIRIKRLNIAERLYRVTGEGVYRDGILLGRPVLIQQPLLNGQVMGQDTVIATPYREKIYWFWGDTERASYPLGNFGASGATSEWPRSGGLDPSAGVNLTYFTDAHGFSKPMVPWPDKGLRWIEAVLTVPDDRGVERLVARVANHRDLSRVDGWYLMVFNDEKAVFESVRRWDIHQVHDSAHPFRAWVNGREYAYLYPNWRVRPDLKSLADLQSYEAFTCVAGDGKLQGKDALDRDDSGRVRYTWKAGADRLHPGRVGELIAAGALKPDESWIQLHDAETGQPVPAGRGSVFWNEFRRRWVMLITGQTGEVWFAEGDTPAGPWVYARRVVSHDTYNFYNPTQHPFFDHDGGRVIYFEGTFTASFSGARVKTPRYDYNQIMYRLALDDPRLALPVPVYRMKPGDGKTRYLLRDDIERAGAWESVEDVAFFAVDPAHSRAGLLPITAEVQDGRTVLIRGGSKPLFFGLPAGEDNTPAMVSLYEYQHTGATRIYSTNPNLDEPGLNRSKSPLCRVWMNPMKTLALDWMAKPAVSEAR